MRVSRLVVLAVAICIVIQVIDARNLKFKTFGSGDLGGSTGTSGSPSLSPAYSPSINGGNSPSPSYGGTAPSPSMNGGFTPAPTRDDVKPPTQAPTKTPSYCTTIGWCNTATGTPTTGSGGSTTPTVTVDRAKEYTTGVLTNYDDKDEDANKTDVTVATVDAQRTVESKDGYKVYFAGESGLMKIQAPDSSNYVSVKFRKLADSDGQKAINFENATWNWEGPTSTIRQGLQATVLTATGFVAIDTNKGIRAYAKFFVEVLTFNQTGSFKYGNDTLFVDTTSAKISYNITGWPFDRENGSFLYLAVTVNSNGRGINNSVSGSAISVGQAIVSAPPLVYADDEPKTMEVFFSKDSDDDTGCQGRVLMVFPQFSNTLYYDPIVSPQEVSGSTTAPTSAPTSSTTSSKGAMTSSLSLITALFAVLLMLAF